MGFAIAEYYRKQGISPLQTSRNPTDSDCIFLDLLNPDVTNLPKSIQCIFLCAAVTSIEQCEKNPGYSRQVNVDSIQPLVEYANACGGKIIYPSTSMIFDGSLPAPAALSPLNPISEYGRQKADAEEIIRTQADSFSIIRFSKIISSPFKLFTFWLEAMKKGQEIFAFKDMYFSPINMKFAVNVLTCIAALPENIMINCSASDQLSYYEAACFLAKHAGLDTRLIIPSSATDSGLTHNCRYVTLGTRELQDKLGLLPPSTINFLKDYLLDDAL